MNRRSYVFAISIIFLLGIWVRYSNLDYHFTHVDDIIIADNILKKKKDVANDSTIHLKTLTGVFKSSHYISRNLTYAPMQFWVTSWMVNAGQSYREILFWGRLPSFLFGVVGLFMFILFYKKFKPENPLPYQILGLTLLAFSWENIIYAQQMESYSIGIVSILTLLILFLYYLKKKSLSWFSILLLGFFSALLVSSQYQILFFIPALYFTLFIYYRKHLNEKIFLLLGKFILSGITFILLIWPMYHNYLRHHTQGGINWNAGPGREFVYHLSGIEGLADTLIYSSKFFLLNFFTVFQMELAFLPTNSILFQILSFLLLLLFIIGIYSFFKTNDVTKKYLGIFFAASGFIWFSLLLFQKLALSPTRHNLILLPLFVILICEGLEYIIRAIKKNKDRIFYISSLSLSLCILALFFTSFKEINQSRKDQFEEKEISAILNQHKPDLVIQYFFTYNIGLMKNIRDNYLVFEGDRWQIDDHTPDCDTMHTIAFISARIPYPSEYFSCQKGFMNEQRELIIADSTDGNFKLVYKKEILSDVEVDFSKKTSNGTNSLFLYIFKRIKK